VPNLVHGSDAVTRAIVRGMSKLAPKNLVRRMAQIHGNPGVITYLERRPSSVFTIDGTAEQIRAIYVVTSPEKLSHLPPLSGNRLLSDPITIHREGGDDNSFKELGSVLR
jgi:RNA polymerase sigma-70 factor, ECF subfamily